MTMIKTGVFGEIVGELGKDYFLVGKLPNGNSLCLTSNLRAAAPDQTTCCARAGASWKHGGHRCSKPAKTFVQVERNVRTSTSHYGQTVYQFELTADDIVVGEAKPLTETVSLPYCKLHDPAAIGERQAKREATEREQRQAELKRQAAQREAETNRYCKAAHYDHVTAAAQKVLDTFFASGSNLTSEQIQVLAELEAKMKLLPTYFAAAKANYGSFGDHMIDANGNVKEYYVPGKKSV